MADTQTVASFVENVNAVANATSLATGDIVEDTQAARDEAVRAATEALASETNANDSEELAHDWADKGHNNPVIGTAGVDAEYSSYHWATEASLVIGDPLINDLSISSLKTWSSLKVSNELALKSDVTHNHDGVYEFAFTKNTGFNKPFPTASGEAGSLDVVARSDHKHDLVYEPKVIAKTAYNKDFGTTSGTVMQGDANFDTSYMPIATINSAYNKNFVADANAPTADEVPRGNHIHTAAGITYDNTNTQIGSSTAQGAITELDGKLSILSVAESSFISLLGHTQYTQVIAAQNTPTKVLMPLPAVQSNSNATNNSNAEVTVEYPAGERPNKLVQGTFSIVIRISNVEEFSLSIAVDGVVAGETMKGTGDLVITQFITGLDVSDIGVSSKLSVMIANLDNSADAVIESMNMVWNGNPEGALVASGTSVDHSDLTGTGAANGVHTTSDIQNLDTDLAARASKIGIPVLDNVLIMDAGGDLKDSGVQVADIGNGMDKIAVPTLDNLVSMDSGGNSKDAGIAIAGLALLGGNATQIFKVEDGVATNDAINFAQLSAVKTTADGAIPKVPTPTDGNFPQVNSSGVLVDSIYDETSFATAVHTHAISDTTGLQDALDGKYDEITAVTDNLMGFGAGNIVIDSGISRLSTILTGEDV